MVSDWQKHRIIREFLIPDELKDDIAYCQRSLRSFVKVHQYLTERCKDLQEEQQTLVKRYQQELEAEIRAIGKEQSVLVDNLTQQLKVFQHRTATERHIELADDLANGYVAWVLSNHCEVNGATGMCQPPHKVSERLSEWQLYQKYRLPDTLIPVLPSIEDGSAAPEEGGKRAEKRIRTRPVLQTSLLKPATERTATPETVIAKPKAADSLTPPVTPPSPTQSVQRSPSSSVSMAVKTVAATPAGGGSNKRKAIESSSAMVESKTLRSRATTNVVGGPAKGGKTVEPVEDTEPGDTFDDSSASSVATVDGTVAMKRGRSSLYHALNKAKLTQKTSPPNSATKGNRGVATAANTIAGGANGNGRGSETAARATSVSSDSSNSRSSTPGSSRKAVATEPPVTSDDSSNERFLPPEDYCPPPDTIHEWEQYTFLKLYGLYTLEDSRLLKERKNERKRRSCCSTERKDFHYGRYDQFEQQYYVLSKRRTNGNKRPALLYTATTVAERCMSHRKQQQQQRTGAGSWSTTSTEPSPLLASSPEDAAAAVVAPTSRSESPASEPQVTDSSVAVLELNNKMCFVCNEPGTNDSLSTCVECCNTYHINCHTDEKEETLEKTLPAPAVLASPAEDNTDVADDGTAGAADTEATATEGSSAIDDNAEQILPPQRDNLCPGCFKIAAHKAQLRVA
ncbi:uncharacterized protein LOC126574845 [Anopheles aquasalis]|uniref:uncharacterized protein LOC126574845 n=1 Tax=Anopheles aquasalis TaxID=42839 RepID=UPI00215A6A0B|nr:uncharacterized protein LOC126574845 [Anopheles aquasalis]